MGDFLCFCNHVLDKDKIVEVLALHSLNLEGYVANARYINFGIQTEIRLKEIKYYFNRGHFGPKHRMNIDGP